MSHQEMTAGDLMTTALITMKPDDTVGHAEFEMHLAAIRHVPIVDDRNRLVGIVSNRDILRKLGKDGARKVVMREIMARDVETVSEDTAARDAAELMLEKKIGALPVTGEDQQLVGIVTETDFVRLAYRVLGGTSY